MNFRKFFSFAFEKEVMSIDALEGKAKRSVSDIVEAGEKVIPSQATLKNTGDAAMLGVWVSIANGPTDAFTGEVIFGSIALSARTLEILLYSDTPTQDLVVENIKIISDQAVPPGPYKPFVEEGKNIIIDNINENMK